MIETGRLRLREFRREDLGALAAMVADPEQMSFYPRARTRDEAAAWIELPRAGHRGRRRGARPRL